MSGELALGYPTFPRALQIGPAEAECFLSRDDLYRIGPCWRLPWTAEDGVTLTAKRSLSRLASRHSGRRSTAKTAPNGEADRDR